MNRFSSYLQSQKLSKAYLEVALDRYNRGDGTMRIIDPLLKSIREFQTCTNNLASLAFEKRKKKK